jgi:hypothetical protein
MSAPVAFVGRERELSRLLAALRGGVRLVLVVGDAGVGKTRFVGEGTSRAEAAGMVQARPSLNGPACWRPATLRGALQKSKYPRSPNLYDHPIRAARP